MTVTSSSNSLNIEARPSTPGRLLVIDDDPTSQGALESLFSSEGYQVELAEDSLAGLEIVRNRPPSTIIFNLRTSRSSGYEVCRHIVRLAPDVPLIVLSTYSDIVSKVILLEMGADECVSIPFTPTELVARLRALLRRASRNGRELKCVFEDVLVDFSSMDVTRRGEKVFLTAKEFKTMEFMTKRPYRVVSRDELLNEVWGYQNYPCTRTVDNHILKLRQKLERDPSDPSHFLTVHGIGYKFVP
ncbi:MAG: response regulator transcription factor [Acidobacteria bacterium]|nr:response regulator transcription factor [Acidobacteriota bacterium]